MPYPKLGPVLFVTSLQYFIVQVLVGRRFLPSYSLAHNTISDLGNTMCSYLLCSPSHYLMNLSFVILGVTMIAGSALIYRGSQPSRLVALGFGLFALGGLGTLLVGLSPENTIAGLHEFGASLPFLVGNLGLLILGRSSAFRGWLRTYTTFTATLALVALLFYVSQHFVGLGKGGMERIVAYPQTVWMIVVGSYLLWSKQLQRSDPSD